MKSIVITDTAGKEIVKKSLSTGSKRVRQGLRDEINRLEGMTDEKWDEENERKIGDV